MGIKISPDDPVLGNECQLFGIPAETPETIYVYFWDIVTCPGRHQAPTLRVFSCHQRDGIPCHWRNHNGGTGWKCDVMYLDEPRQNHVNLLGPDFFSYFIGYNAGAPPEHDIFDNERIACNGNIGGYDGHAIIFWKDAAVQLIEDMNLPTDVKVLMEFFVSDDHKPIYKFCIEKYSMNVKFLLSP